MRYVGILAMLSLSMGCGSNDGLPRVRATGRVIAAGQPVGDALIRFIPEGATRGSGGFARTNSEGQFDLTDARGQWGGIVPGAYRVTVSRLIDAQGVPLPAGKSELDVPGTKQSMPAMIVGADSTPLTCTVPEAGGEVKIEIPESIVRKQPTPIDVRPGGY
jgi:hypothetical protein